MEFLVKLSLSRCPYPTVEPKHRPLGHTHSLMTAVRSENNPRGRVLTFGLYEKSLDVDAAQAEHFLSEQHIIYPCFLFFYCNKIPAHVKRFIL